MSIWVKEGISGDVEKVCGYFLFILGWEGKYWRSSIVWELL